MTLSIMLKASLLLAAVAVVDALFRRRLSAASRYWLWTLTMTGLLLLPVVSLAVPAWPLIRVAAPAVDAAPIAPALDAAVVGTAAGPVSAASAPARDAAPMPWSVVLLAGYVGGVSILLARLAIGHRSMHRLTRRATDVQDPAWTRLLRESQEQLRLPRRVRLLRSADETMPMAVGVWRAAIVIPPVADTWSEDRRRAVLLHELAHVARRDCASYLLASVACALYWCHPGVWWVARRLRIERELACDDCVLQTGTEARDYAGHLLDLAFTLRLDRVPALAIRMASSRQIEGRMLAALDADRNRTVPSLRSRLAGIVGLVGLAIPLGAATAVPGAAAAGAESMVAADPSPIAQTSAADKPDQLPGTWEIRPSGKDGSLHLRLTDTTGSRGSNVTIASLEGLSPAQIAGAGTPVQFRSRREAGTFAFEGSCRGGVCGGTWIFTADPAFADGLAKRGLDRPSAADHRRLAMADVGLAFLDELKAQNYPLPTIGLLVRSADHGVGLSYLREMGQLGYRVADVETLIRMRDHGVGPEFIKELAAQGLPKLSADELVRARDHGVGADYIRGLRELGHTLDLESLVRARDHGVGPDFVREVAALGYPKLPIDELIRLRDHGVSPDFIKAFKSLGYDSLTTSELVSLRDHGATADKVRDANARAGSRLPVDRLISLASRGWS